MPLTPKITSCEVKLISEFVHFFQHNSKYFQTMRENEQLKISAQYLPLLNYKKYINQIPIYPFSLKVC